MKAQSGQPTCLRSHSSAVLSVGFRRCQSRALLDHNWSLISINELFRAYIFLYFPHAYSSTQREPHLVSQLHFMLTWNTAQRPQKHSAFCFPDKAGFSRESPGEVPNKTWDTLRFSNLEASTLKIELPSLKIELPSLIHSQIRIILCYNMFSRRLYRELASKM